MPITQYVIMQMTGNKGQGPRHSEVLTREIGAQCPGQNLRARLHQEEKLTSETLGLKVKCKFDPR